MIHTEGAAVKSPKGSRGREAGAGAGIGAAVGALLSEFSVCLDGHVKRDK